MSSERTYILARVWKGFGRQIDLSAFDDVPNQYIQRELEAVAAAWIRGGITPGSNEHLLAWARAIPGPSEEVAKRLTDSALESIGVQFFVLGVLGTRFLAPHWTILHAEDCLEHAEAVADGVFATVQLRDALQLQLTRQSEVNRAQALVWERYLADWDGQVLRWLKLRESQGVAAMEIKRLHDEAVAFGPIVRRLVRPSPDARISGGSLLDGELEPEQAPRSSPTPETIETGGEIAYLVRRDKVWDIGFEDERRTLPSRVGFIYLAELVRQAGRRVDVLHLRGLRASALAQRRNGALDWGESDPQSSPHSQPVMDDKMISAVSARAATLNEEFELAVAAEDDERASKVSLEAEQLEEQLRQQIGLGGRSRAFNGDLESARKSVGEAIGSALKVLDAESPKLGAHLRLAIDDPYGASPRYSNIANVHWLLS